jgi:hypothetical protein
MTSQTNDKPVVISNLNSFSATAGFNFATDSAINNFPVIKETSTTPILPDVFLLLPSPLDFFLLLDGSSLLLLGS